MRETHGHSPEDLPPAYPDGTATPLIEPAKPSFIVGIGASAGGLDSLEKFFSNMPDRTGVAFVVIQHLSPDYKSMMVELLAKHTKMAIKQAENNMAVEPDTVYLIPPKMSLTIAEHKLHLAGRAGRAHVLHLPIDIFFRSLAQDMEGRAVGVVLSGTGSDGTLGSRAIKEAGGMLMVQDPASAPFDGMPNSVIHTGVADYVAPPEEMPALLLKYVKHPLAAYTAQTLPSFKDEDTLNTILDLIKGETGLDFSYYKPATVIRRIERRMGINQIDKLAHYQRYLEKHPGEIQVLYSEPDTLMQRIQTHLLDLHRPPTVALDHEHNLVHTIGDVDQFLHLPKGQVSFNIFKLTEKSLSALVSAAIREEPLDLGTENFDARKLVQKLRVHQIELEIQKEELRQAQQQIAENAEQYSDLYDFAPVGYLTLDKNTIIRRVNLTAAALLDTPREKLLNKPLIIRIPTAYHTVLNTHVRSVLAGHAPAPCELEVMRANGKCVWVTVSSRRHTSAVSGEPVCRITLTDISELKEAENALHASEEKYRLIADNTIDCIWRTNMDMQLEYVNPAIFPMLGYRQEEWLASRLSDHCTAEDLYKMRVLIASEIAKGVAASGVTFEANMRHRDGRLVAVEMTSKVLFNEYSEPVGLQGVARDISERKRAEEEIRKFKLLAENATYGVLIANLEGGITYTNATFAAMHGYEVEEMIGNSLSILQPKGKWNPVHPLGSGGQEYEEFGAREIKHVRKDGTEFDVLLNCTLVRDDSGTASFLAVTATDITELKSLEAQLQQAQKMEAIGHLVGGVAHDFNNLLTVIINRADFIQEALPPLSASRTDVEEIIEASLRGAALIRQLLAFSRRQHLTIKRLDINNILRGVEKMLQRLIGEDIELTMQLTETPCTVCADAGQLEQVILNLAVNARDAMPSGGKLTIETRHVSIRPEDVNVAVDPDHPPEGDYVAIAISDTGCGMDKSIQAQIFDPFFTTKDVGKGTGLGLSTVHGIIKQHKGFIDVYSELAKGTTFRLLLPMRDDATGEHDWDTKSTRLPRGHETILLVDDDPAVRRVSARMLRDLGYRVLEAENGKKGLDVIQENQEDIAVLLTDIVMPEMDGKRLAEQARALLPDLRIVLTSGYPEAHLKLRNAWVNDHPLLQKPFVITELAQCIRKALDD